jgi:hypothetical protein
MRVPKWSHPERKCLKRAPAQSARRVGSFQVRLPPSHVVLGGSDRLEGGEVSPEEGSIHRPILADLWALGDMIDRLVRERRREYSRRSTARRTTQQSGSHRARPKGESHGRGAAVLVNHRDCGSPSSCSSCLYGYFPRQFCRLIERDMVVIIYSFCGCTFTLLPWKETTLNTNEVRTNLFGGFGRVHVGDCIRQSLTVKSSRSFFMLEGRIHYSL